MGMGMSIVKELVELIDGQLRLRSKLGRDTTMMIPLPRMNAPADHRAAPEAQVMPS
jgi:signal transduction histidine kinase